MSCQVFLTSQIHPSVKWPEEATDCEKPITASSCQAKVVGTSKEKWGGAKGSLLWTSWGKLCMAWCCQRPSRFAVPMSLLKVASDFCGSHTDHETCPWYSMLRWPASASWASGREKLLLLGTLWRNLYWMNLKNSGSSPVNRQIIESKTMSRAVVL